MKRVLVFFLCAIAAMAGLAMQAQTIAGKGQGGQPGDTSIIQPTQSPHGAFSVEPAEGEGRTVIDRDDSGQFRLNARVNGHDTRFMIDTGADFVALTVGSAQDAGLPVDTAAFQPITRTASGTGNGATYTVEDLEVAGKTFHNMQVVVVEGLQTNLLGQSALSQIGRVELRGDRMVIERD
ncbi:MAG: TIGR02281 family clan AA aspartic protease [Novosphingobium sp.]